MDLFSLDLPEGENKEFQIALVDDPAIERDWLAFSKQDNQFNFSTKGDNFKLISRNFSIESEDKRIISGYAMIADLEIPRFDEIRGAYNVVFRKEAIEKIWLNFQRNNLNTNTNIMHQTNDFAKGVFVCESIFIDSERGAKAHEGFTQEADGSWFISMKVENDEVWQQVKEGKFKGFSIEGRFTEEPDNFTKIKELINTNKMSKQTLKDKLKEYFNANPNDATIVKEVVENKFETAKLVDGTDVTIEPAIEVGAAIVIMDMDGNPIAAPIAEYELEDGRVIVVAVEGVIAEVKEVESEDEVIAPITEEPMGDEANQEQKVKRIIESIVSEKIFEIEKVNAFLKAENEALKKDQVDLKADFAAFKKEQSEAFESLKTFSKEVFDELLDEPVKESVKTKFNPFKTEKKGNMFLTK
jgi:hypothetical protein